jgi:hypothetical protein
MPRLSAAHELLTDRLLEKLGMSLEKPVRMPGEDEDILLYSIDTSLSLSYGSTE